MILVFGGTTEANKTMEALLQQGHKVTLSCATKTGNEAANKTITYSRDTIKGWSKGTLQIRTGKLDKAGILDVLKKNNCKAVVDATHPFAVQVSQNAKDACAQTSTPYYRLERKNVHTDNYGLVVRAKNFEHAAEEATKLGKNIFLTIGVNNIGVFVEKAKKTGARITARILKQNESLETCLKAGIKKENIISEMGPFTSGQNIDHFLQNDAEVVVSKDSGLEGGLLEKAKAAQHLKIPIVLVDRPDEQEDAFYDIDELIKQVSNNV